MPPPGCRAGMRQGTERVGHRSLLADPLDALLSLGVRFGVKGPRSGDTLEMPDGEEVPAQVISYTIERVSMRGRREVWFMLENLPVPSDLPVAVGVNSDDLPNEQEYVSAQRRFYVRPKETTSR